MGHLSQRPQYMAYSCLFNYETFMVLFFLPSEHLTGTGPVRFARSACLQTLLIQSLQFFASSNSPVLQSVSPVWEKMLGRMRGQILDRTCEQKRVEIMCCLWTGKSCAWTAFPSPSTLYISIQPQSTTLSQSWQYFSTCQFPSFPALEVVVTTCACGCS